jgi:hypothetical protein
MDELIRELASARVGILLLCFGFILILLGLIGQLRLWFTLGRPLRITASISGGVLLLSGIFLQAGADYLPGPAPVAIVTPAPTPTAGSTRTPVVSATSTPTAPSGCSSTDVITTTPVSESTVSIVATVQGTACEIPSTEELWVLIVPDGVTAYYPQPGPVVVTNDGKWSASATVGQNNDSGRGFVLVTALADQEGSAAIQAYFHQSGSDFKGLYPLPKGIQLMSQVHVIRT